MKVAMVAGGTIEKKSALAFLRIWSYDRLIGIDRGAEFLYEQNLFPDLLVGDFDSLSADVLDYYRDKVPICKHPARKDATDTELGIRSALDMGAEEIAILGGTGTRLDHVMANIQSLMIPLREGAEAFLQDANNRIRLVCREKYYRKEQMFGKYVSFFPLTSEVEGLTLEGAAYPLCNHTLTSDNSLGVSNEVTGEFVHISLKKGILLMIESKD